MIPGGRGQSAFCNVLLHYSTSLLLWPWERESIRRAPFYGPAARGRERCIHRRADGSVGVQTLFYKRVSRYKSLTVQETCSTLSFKFVTPLYKKRLHCACKGVGPQTRDLSASHPSRKPPLTCLKHTHTKIVNRCYLYDRLLSCFRGPTVARSNSTNPAAIAGEPGRSLKFLLAASTNSGSWPTTLASS